MFAVHKHVTYSPFSQHPLMQLMAQRCHYLVLVPGTRLNGNQNLFSQPKCCHFSRCNQLQPVLFQLPSFHASSNRPRAGVRYWQGRHLRGDSRTAVVS